jgi:hypothetical protein
MGNRKARKRLAEEAALKRLLEKEALEKARAEAWEHIHSVPRGLDEPVIAPDIGTLRMQLVVRTAFAGDWVWDVRAHDQDWLLFQPQVVGGRELRVIGYEALPFSSEKLAMFYRRVTSLTLPLAPELDLSGRDGATTQLSVFGDMYSEWRFQWWNESYPPWRPLVSLAEEMVAEFRAVGPARRAGT